jgi:arylsulfatase A-like enzyme
MTLAESLHGAGYRTEAVLGSPWTTAQFGFDQGFDGFESVRAQEPFDLGPMRGRALGRLLGCRRDSAACRLYARGHALLFDTPLPSGYGGDEANARAAHFVEMHGGERFFLWVHYAEAMPPYDLEPPFRPLPEDPQASTERRLKKLGYWEMGDPFTLREELLPVDAQGLAALYDGEVHRIDRLVGGLVGMLEANGLADRTLVVFTSNHGQELLDHGSYTYGHSLYNELLRVPLIVAGPGVTSPGQAVETPVSLVDLAPTLAEIGGAPVLAEAEGRSLIPALRGQALDDMPVYSEALYRVYYELKAVLHGGYKLIYRPENGHLELYDLRADPAEQHDLAAQAAEVTQAMKDELLAWLAHIEEQAGRLPRAAPPAEVREAVW